MLALSLLSISVHGTSCKERGLPGDASHIALSYDLAHIGWQGRKQDVVGPLQDDEALLLFALSRALGVNRVLEIGSLNGDSARNFLSAVRCTLRAKVISVDPSPTVPMLAENHVVVRKDAASLSSADLDNLPVELLLLDCHDYQASQKVVRRILSQQLLSATGLIVLHDTGLHPAGLNYSGAPHASIGTKAGRSWQGAHGVDLQVPSHRLHVMHQPVERLLAQWIEKYDAHGNWQRLAVHDDFARGAVSYRHGLTVMQRKQSLHVPSHLCRSTSASSMGFGGSGPASREECISGQVDRTIRHPRRNPGSTAKCKCSSAR